MSMELALSKQLTSSQSMFCELVASGIDKNDAAERAGYGTANPSAEASRLLQQPAILATIQINIAKRLAIGAPLAVNVLMELVSDKAMHPKLRLDAANSLLNRAGHIAPKATAPGAAGDVPLNEMSMADLRALADKLESELANRAKPVSSAKAAPSTPQAIDDII